MDSRQFSVLAGILLVILVGVGFQFSLPRPPSAGTSYSEFLENRLKWNAKKPVSYVMDYEFLGGMMLWAAHITKNIDGTSAIELRPEPEDPRERAYRTNPKWFPYDLDRLFELLDEQYKKRASRIELNFHPDFGFPREISVDPDKNRYDDEFNLKVTEFAPRNAS